MLIPQFLNNQYHAGITKSLPWRSAMETRPWKLPKLVRVEEVGYSCQNSDTFRVSLFEYFRGPQ